MFFIPHGCVKMFVPASDVMFSLQTFKCPQVRARSLPSRRGSSTSLGNPFFEDDALVSNRPSRPSDDVEIFRVVLNFPLIRDSTLYFSWFLLGAFPHLNTPQYRTYSGDKS